MTRLVAVGVVAVLVVGGCSESVRGSGTRASEAQVAPLRLADLPPGEWQLNPFDFTPNFGVCPDLPPVAEAFDQVVFGNGQYWVFQAVGRADEPERRMDAVADHTRECQPEPEGQMQADLGPSDLQSRGDRTVGAHAEGTTSDGSRYALDIAYVQLADVVSAVGVLSSPDGPADPPAVELLNDLVERALQRMTVEAAASETTADGAASASGDALSDLDLRLELDDTTLAPGESTPGRIVIENRTTNTIVDPNCTLMRFKFGLVPADQPEAPLVSEVEVECEGSLPVAPGVTKRLSTGAHFSASEPGDYLAIIRHHHGIAPLNVPVTVSSD